MSDVETYSTFPPKRAADDPLAPPPALMKLLDEPIKKIKQWDGNEAWLISRYVDVRDALNSRAFSADPRRPGFPEKSAAYAATIGQDRNLRTMDDPEHSEQKRMLVRDFTIKRVREMRPAIQEKVDSLIDEMLAQNPPVDFVSNFALAVPTMVICEMLGVPYEDRDYFAHHSMLCLSSDVPPETSGQSAAELFSYMEKLVDIKDASPDNDLISRLVVDQLRPGILSRHNVIELARFILIAGHETTANMIALSTLALLRNPDQAEYFRQGMDQQALSNAISELFRYLSITHTGRRRVAVEDVKIGGQLIRAGEGVIILNSVADRDPSIFEDAGKLDLHRVNAKKHMAFGAGMHRCMGAFLSEVEMEIVHSTLWKRVPTLALAIPFEEVDFYDGGSVYGVRSLPVKW